MSGLSLILRELIGMFIDDQFLALAVLVVVGVAGALALLLGAPQLMTGTVLVAGCRAGHELPEDQPKRVI